MQMIDEGLAESAGEERGFELGGAPHGQLGAGHRVDGFELLGVYGTVAVDEVGAKLVELGGILEAHDGEAGGAGAVLGGVQVQMVDGG